MNLSELYESINNSLSSKEKMKENLEVDIGVLKIKKDSLEILKIGKVVDQHGIGSVLDYIAFFDKNGFSAIPKEYVKEIFITEKEKLNIVSLDDLMTAKCPVCDKEAPYMQREFVGGFFASGRYRYISFVIHCDDVRKVEHEFVEEKFKNKIY